MGPTYIHELSDWPDFVWNYERLAASLGEVRNQQGRLLGQMATLGFPLQEEATLQTLTTDVVKTSEIEGERLDPEQVRSSLARRLGMDGGGLGPRDRNVEGIVEVMIDATSNYGAPLTEERLFHWHEALFPTGRNEHGPILTGAWRDDRDGPMQVVSGAIGNEHVHFEAPAAARLPSEMRRFLDWFNSETETDPVLKAAIAHLWFVTLHPFEDGNGRLARAIADMAMARAEGSPRRFYSMSAQIRQERAKYYDVLEWTQRGSMDVTSWLDWFLGCLGRAIDGSGELLAAVLQKARFWESAAGLPLNEREILVLNRLLSGFQGNLTNAKYSKLAKCSPPTAVRDISHLLELGLLIRNPGGGRNTSYSVNQARLSRGPSSAVISPRTS